jgi:ABC-type sugar transport system ATPase subunit
MDGPVTATGAAPPGVGPRIAVAARSVSKRYGGVQALQDASLDIRPGTVHGLLGENGAGKSTLVKILAGAVMPDSGTIHVAEEPVQFGSPADARRRGIAVVHQELSLFPHLTVPSNVYAGRELHGAFGSLRTQRMHDELVATLDDIGWAVPLDRPVGRLSLAEQQMVEIVRAFHHRADLVLLDEPNSALTEAESEDLFAAVRRFRARGQAFLLVSHRLDEVLAIADEVTILRDGKVVHRSRAAELTVRDTVRLMVGAVSTTVHARESSTVGPVSLEVEDLRAGRLEALSFDVREGQIVGIAGLEGAGVQDLFDALFGVRQHEAGTCRFAGEAYAPASPADAIVRGVASIPADRRTDGLLMARPVSENIVLVILDRLRSRRWFVADRAIRQTAQRFVERFRIRAASVDSSVTTLSGGNQQKVVLSKWLATRPKLLLLNDPTRGIDVGAKAEVHDVIRELAADGMAILVWSSEYDELLGLCDRILVLHEGRLFREVDPATTTRRDLLLAVVGGEGA